MKQCPICHEELVSETVDTIPGNFDTRTVQIMHCPNWLNQWHAEAVAQHEYHMANPLPADFKLNLPVDDAVHMPDSN